jgi:hypothetical protein
MTDPVQANLLFGKYSIQFSSAVLLNKSRLFTTNRSYLTSGYRVRSSVTPFEFNAFLDFLEFDRLPNLEVQNGVLQLIEEFQVDDGAFLSGIIREQAAKIAKLIEINSRLQAKIEELTTRQTDFESRFEESLRAIQKNSIERNPADSDDGSFNSQLQLESPDLQSPEVSVETNEEFVSPDSQNRDGIIQNDSVPIEIRSGSGVNQEDPFIGGLIAHLHARGAYVIAHSSTVIGRDPTREPRNLLDGNPKTYFQSEREKTQPWFMVQFTTVKVQVTDYALRGWTVLGSLKNLSPKSWILEGANERFAEEWEEIDEQRDCELLGRYENKKNSAAKFSVLQPGQYFQFIRLRQTGLNHDGSNFLAASQFEVFGRVTDL